jgi:ribosomal protein L16/L10AE
MSNENMRTIQIERDVYDGFAMIARSKGIKIRVAALEAIREWMNKHIKEDKHGDMIAEIGELSIIIRKKPD